MISSLFGCENYNSEYYVSAENEAIREIIPQITDFKGMSQLNNGGRENLKLYLISTLSTQVSKIHEPKEEYLISVNGIELSESEISENKTQNLIEIEIANNEKRIFADLINGTIKERRWIVNSNTLT